MGVVPADGPGAAAEPGIADTLDDAKAAFKKRYEEVKKAR